MAQCHVRHPELLESLNYFDSMHTLFRDHHYALVVHQGESERKLERERRIDIIAKLEKTLVMLGANVLNCQIIFYCIVLKRLSTGSVDVQ